jgi:hypothetical protein
MFKNSIHFLLASVGEKNWEFDTVEVWHQLK